MDLALNNLQRLMYHKTQINKQEAIEFAKQIDLATRHANMTLHRLRSLCHP